MIVVADASPIICLSRIHRVELVTQVFGTVLVPGAVRIEIAAGPGGDDLLRANPWLECRTIESQERAARLGRELDAGEAEAIVLAIEAQADLLLMDERRGRAVAEREGVAVIGIVGVLLRARSLGLVPALAPLLEDLVTRGRFHLRGDVIARALALANEETAD